MSQIIAYAIRFLFILPAIIVHEVAHGWVAHRLGDPTAKNAGRLSLNPIRHIDPWGTLMLPALLIFAGLPAFGYAKPVPINPYFFQGDRRTGLMLTGLAGPATNLLLATVVGLFVRFVGGVATLPDLLTFGLLYFTYINLVLVFFNLIPIPPFDGSRVLPMFLPESAMHFYGQVERFGFIIIFALLFLAPGLLSTYFGYTVVPIFRAIVGPLSALIVG